MIYTIVSRLGEIDWAVLRPGDTVLVSWRPEPYRERLAIGGSGSGVTVRGLRGPNGERPVIDGENATTDPQFALNANPDSYDATAIEPAGLITLYRTVTSPGRPVGLTIEGLEIRNAGVGQFTDARGAVRDWATAAAGVYGITCDDLTVRDCVIRGNGQGVHVLGNHRNRGVLIEDNLIYDNGVVGSDKQHGTYVEAGPPVTYRRNTYLANKPGSKGGALKDRSADPLIESNTIAGGTRVIDLSSWQDEPADGPRVTAPNATRSRILDNVLIPPVGTTRVVYVEGRYNADRTVGDQLEFSRNTVVARVDKATSYYVSGFVVEYSDSARVSAGHNLFDVTALTPGTPNPELRLFPGKGSIDIGPNWSRNPVSRYAAGYGAAGSPKATGWENIVVGNAAPGYRDEAAGDYRLAEGAPAAGYGADLTAPPPEPDPAPDPTPDPAPDPPAYEVVSETVQTSGPFRVTVKVEVKEV